jgi:PadR family transcriptional regulator PadR
MHSDKEEMPGFQERWEGQLRKGTLEMATLAVLWGRRLYGLEILRSLASDAQLTLGEGTIYPILNRLKMEGLLSAEWVEAEAGHPRKYYSLTAAGHVRLHSMAEAWVDFTRRLNSLLTPLMEAKEMVK